MIRPNVRKSSNVELHEALYYKELAHVRSYENELAWLLIALAIVGISVVLFI